WVTNGVGIKTMDAILLQQIDALTNTVVTFSGFCASNTLANSDTSSYTNTAFIRDFNSGFSVLVATNIPLIGGQPFSITLDMTADDPGHHVQWGFETIGRDADPSTAASLGQTVVSINPPIISAGAS